MGFVAPSKTITAIKLRNVYWNPNRKTLDYVVLNQTLPNLKVWIPRLNLMAVIQNDAIMKVLKRKE